jgi:hypothetical protein
MELLSFRGVVIVGSTFLHHHLKVINIFLQLNTIFLSAKFIAKQSPPPINSISHVS